MQIKTDASGYTMVKVLGELILDYNSSDYVIFENPKISKLKVGPWQSMTFFLKKMIPVKTTFKTHNDELLTIIKAFKTWRHYLESCKHKIFILTKYNNLCQFMTTKS